MRKYLFPPLLFIFLAACSGNSSKDKKNKPNPPDQDSIPAAPEYSDQELLKKVQEDVLHYFWDDAETNSKLARERYETDNPNYQAHTVTVGGSGFGLMTLLVGIENGYLPREKAVPRLITALNFLKNADRFHGAWPHWLDGNTGKVKPFGPDDDGADLVETAFLVEGLICVREYFKDSSDNQEQTLAKLADTLWKGVEWDWFTQGEEEGLYWHWSPHYNFQKNMKLQGYDETLITYILAAASPEHAISKEVYQNGWARRGQIKSSNSQYDIPTIVAHNGQNGHVGPMFWSQYSFIGLDPRGLSDDYVDYGKATTNHAKIMYEYAIDNPHDYSGYGPNSWGLTASYTRNKDGSTGYAAHSPNNDTGVISPTAALSDMPYTPKKSRKVLRFLYHEKKEKLIGTSGPYDAYSLGHNWVTPRYLAIDQGTIAPMIENYKSGFLWELFMNAPDIREGLKKLGFHSSQHGF